MEDFYEEGGPTRSEFANCRSSSRRNGHKRLLVVVREAVLESCARSSSSALRS